MEESKLYQKLKIASKEFRSKVLSEVHDGERIIRRAGERKVIRVNKRNLETVTRAICSSRTNSLRDNFLTHIDILRKYASYCSSPKSFRTAWDTRSKQLNPYDADTICNEGGQLVPLVSGSRLFECGQQGVVLGPKKRFILGIRHSEGNYKDKLDDLGRFTYQPPCDTSGMLRYRWCQYLSKTLDLPYILLVIIWFEHKISSKITHAFMIAPAKIIDYKKDLENLNKSFHRPLKLQIIMRSEALSALHLLTALNTTDLAIETRSIMDERKAREWAYDQIHASAKGRQIKKWAKSTGKKCPGGCNREFRDMDLSTISFGHVISQDWAYAFNYLIEKIHHPDNLYLTCKSCNSSLSSNFPDRQLTDRIAESGTIGDWLRANEHHIRNIR